MLFCVIMLTLVQNYPICVKFIMAVRRFMDTYVYIVVGSAGRAICFISVARIPDCSTQLKNQHSWNTVISDQKRDP